MSDACLSREMLISFLDGTLNEPGRSTAAQHLNGCTTCQGHAEEIIDDVGSGLIALRSSNVRRESSDRHPAHEDLMHLLNRLKALPASLENREPAANAESDDQTWKDSTRPQYGAAANAATADVALHGRFIPGMRFAGRYRIVLLLGKGAMGEVYRADDLKLHQPVALKMLPVAMCQDAHLRQSILNEVRLARLVTHWNVCRVHDVAEADGTLFLSMEFIEGENLAVLLGRIGRFPFEKALQIARELCLGLEAAHEQGVVHRDLKPTNVMVDLRGRIHIHDFGLAYAATAPQRSTRGFAGTLAYAAPEQLLTGETSVQSDLFSLGMILHEVFFGSRPCSAISQDEIHGWHRAGTPLELAPFARDVDPGVRHVIERCLAHDPMARPASALDVAAAFSGADPVQAALAMGQTPSPTDLAEAGLRRRMSRGQFAACGAAILVLLLTVVTLSQRALGAQLQACKSPDELRPEAERLLRILAPVTPSPVAVDTADGFAMHRDVTGPVYYWHRQASPHLVPRFFVPDLDRPMYLTQGTVSWNDPPFDAPGMNLLWLDGQGFLRGFRLTGAGNAAPQESAPQLDLDAWERRLTDLTGLTLTRAPSRKTIVSEPQKFDLFAEWLAQESDHPDRSWRVTAAFSGPTLVSLRANRVDEELLTADLMWAGGPGRRDLGRVSVMLSTICLLLGCIAVWSGFQGERIDLQTTLLLAAVTFAVSLGAWFLRAKHIAGVAEAAVLQVGLARACLTTGIVFVWYAGIEYYLRRHASELMMGWTKLLRGDVRDPQIGKDLLTGVIGGLGIAVVSEAATSVALRFPTFGLERVQVPLNSLLEARLLLGAIFEAAERAMLTGLGAMLILMVTRLVIQRGGRRRTWAFIAFAGMMTVVFAVVRGREYSLSWLAALVIGLIAATVATRFGLLAIIVMTFVRAMALIPIATNYHAWFYECGLAGILVIAGLGVIGLMLARPALRVATS